MITVQVRLDEDQLAQLAALIVEGSTVTHDKPRTVAEAAEELGVSSDTIRRRIKGGVITPIKGFGKTLIPAEELTRLKSGTKRNANG